MGSLAAGAADPQMDAQDATFVLPTQMINPASAPNTTTAMAATVTRVAIVASDPVRDMLAMMPNNADNLFAC